MSVVTETSDAPPSTPEPPTKKQHHTGDQFNCLDFSDDEEDDNVVILVADGRRICCKLELQNFNHNSVELPLFDEDGNYTNPLEWWAQKEKTYPVLASLAEAFLAIPATSAPLERIWSCAANMVSAKHSRLAPEPEIVGA